MKLVVAAFNQEKALRMDLLFKLYWTVEPGHEQIPGPPPVCGTGSGAGEWMVEGMGGAQPVVNILMTDESLVTRVGGWCR